MSRTFDIAVYDAMSLAGETLIRLLEERFVLAGAFYPLAEISDGAETVEFNGEDVDVLNPSGFEFSDADLLFMPSGCHHDADVIDRARDAGCMIIDGSDILHGQPENNILLPGVNDYRAEDLCQHRYVRLPGSSAAIMLPVLQALHTRFGLNRVNVTACLSVAHMGQVGVKDLRSQTIQLLNGKPAEQGELQHRLAYNIVPQSGAISDSGVSASEQRLKEDVLEVLGENIDVRATCVTAPVFFG